MKEGRIIKVSGPLVVAEGMEEANVYDVVEVSDNKLIGEIIEMRGDKDSVLAFKILGVDVFVTLDAQEARKTIDRIAKENYGIIFVTEQLAKDIPETIKRYNSEVIPAIILIPSNKGSLNIGLANIDKNVEKAIGSNIL